MRTSIIILGVLGAGALAQPQLKHPHHKQKRASLLRQYDEGPNTVVQDYVEYTYVTVGSGDSVAVPAADTAASSVPVSSANVEVNAKYDRPGRHHHHPYSTVVLSYSSAAASPIQLPNFTPEVVNQTSVTPSPSSSLPAAAVVQPIVTPSPSSTSSTAQVVAQPSSAPSAPAASGPNSPPAQSGSSWATSPSSGGKDILTSFNTLRNMWHSSLSAYEFTWNSTLAQNAMDTFTKKTEWKVTTDSQGTHYSPDGSGMGNILGHHLYPGSSAQCIAGGDNDETNTNGTEALSPAEVAFLLWICEIPSDGIADYCKQINAWPGPDCSKCEHCCGHAQIIGGLGGNGDPVGQIGCYYSDKGDVAAANIDEGIQAEKDQLNPTAGLWICDFQQKKSTF